MASSNLSKNADLRLTSAVFGQAGSPATDSAGRTALRPALGLEGLRAYNRGGSTTASGEHSA